MGALLLGRREDEAPGSLSDVEARGSGHRVFREGEGIAVGVDVVGQDSHRHLRARSHAHGVGHCDGCLVEGGARGDTDADPADRLFSQGVLNDVGEGVGSLRIVPGGVFESRADLGDGAEPGRRGRADECHGVAFGVDAFEGNGDSDLVSGDGASNDVLGARGGVRVLVHGDDAQVDDRGRHVTGGVGDRVDDAPGSGAGAAPHAHDVVRHEDASQIRGDLVLEFAGDRELEASGGAVVVQDRHGGHVPGAHDQRVVVEFGRLGLGVGGGWQDCHCRRGRGNPVGDCVVEGGGA